MTAVVLGFMNDPHAIWKEAIPFAVKELAEKASNILIVVVVSGFILGAISKLTIIAAVSSIISTFTTY